MSVNGSFGAGKPGAKSIRFFLPLFCMVLAACSGGSGGSGAGVPLGSSSSSSSSVGNAAFFIPVNAGGLAVVRSDALTASPVTVDGNFYQNLILIENKTYGPDGLIKAYAPSALLYLSKDSNVQTHINLLPLGDISTVPVGHQVSNFSWTPPSQSNPANQTSLVTIPPLVMCPWQLMYEDLNDPGSAFLVFENYAAGTIICTDTTVQIVHIADGATTAPTTVDVRPVAPIYDNTGKLGGIIAYDNAGNLIFANNSSFTSPVTLLSNLTYLQVLNLADPTASVGAGAIFIAAYTADNNTTIYRIDSTGNMVNEYSVNTNTYLSNGISQIIPMAFTVDQHNVYFNGVNTSNNTMSIYQEPLTGGAPTTLLSFAYTSHTANYYNLEYYEFLGSNASSLVYSVTDLGGSGNTTSYYSVRTGVQSANATSIASVSSMNSVSGRVPAELNAPTPSAPAAAQVFLNSTSINGATTMSSTMVVKPDGMIAQALMTDSAFLGTATPFSGTVLQLQGITDTDGYDGGGSLYDFNIVSGLTVPYAVAGGGILSVPENDKSVLYVSAISNNLGTGLIAGNSSATGFVYDSAIHLAVPVGGASNFPTIR